ncbi:cell division protein FtsI/penicillin-binding protein 2 [Paenibacillus phyllosphaerae]|uniref:Cell division protein FtsI/penicillin-binding protein 2 n=1 Tax=Paenibacillus phyllosphaerae TaxID=274593 RepID=A0A7W5AT79_9BACL|nr:penicillin-binding protein 2 [Paenibacillus phyllosphaerae]MBB3108217.1 cell division protein FtsI/penicillin-binding protein 2 [Paenibacillus phyllosphaerae]
MMKGNGLRGKRNTRIFVMALCMSGIMLLLIGRMAWLQMMPASAVTMHSAANWGNVVKQRERTLVLDTGRGDFYDRNGAALTGESYTALAVFPLSTAAREKKKGELARLAELLGVQESELKSWMNGLKEPKYWSGLSAADKSPAKLSSAQKNAIATLHLDGVRLLPFRNRYASSFLARHALGYISQHPEFIRAHYADQLQNSAMLLNEQLGGMGLERSLDKLLHGTGMTTVSYFTDGSNRPLPGLDMRVTSPSNPYYPLRVMTTLDSAIQEQIERVVDQRGLKEGAVVVLDAKNGDIVSMVSRPNLAPLDLGNPGSDLANHAIRAATPGSIFKLVTEAAALEAGVTQASEHFTCNGNYGRYGLHCWKKGGHGELSLQQALSQSCNIAFATIAERLTAPQLLLTADKLGIGRQVGWQSRKPFAPLGERLRLLQEEEAGMVFTATPTRHDGGQLAQTGIGQRDVRLSPLQAANLMLTLLHDGQVLQPRIVREIEYANGQVLAKLPVQSASSAYGRIKPSTVQTLLAGMEEVVRSGTGRAIRHGQWEVAGKSGTAQTVKNGRERNNQWFAGYGPVSSPRYVVCVLAENRKPDTANAATALFRGVMDVLAKADRAEASG